MKMPHEYRKKVKGRCAVCGAPFTGLKTRKTCSNACRLKKSRSKKK